MERRAAVGAGAGLVATAAMSAVMVLAERIGLLRGLPPRLIVDHLLPGVRAPSAEVIAMALHLTIGAAAGGALGAAVPRRGVGRFGVPYGLLLWVVGYEGVVPVLGVLPPAHRDRRGRVVAMIAAHLVYGSVLGRLLRLAP